MVKATAKFWLAKILSLEMRKAAWRSRGVITGAATIIFLAIRTKRHFQTAKSSTGTVSSRPEIFIRMSFLTQYDGFSVIKTLHYFFEQIMEVL